MARRSLRDRNRAAIAAGPEVPDIEPSAGPRGPVHAPAKPVTRTARQSRTASGSTARLGIYLTRDQFLGAKAAYLADWTNGGDADTFARWIAAALDTHAARTPEQRAATAPKGRADRRTGSTRSFAIPTTTVARMRTAITADQHAGRWPTDSAWCGDAIDRAVETARAINGGALPTPPARLPNRLVR
ncbi:hypothetical protein [Propionibacterium sp.]|uniref:hypothetical protein n=1 Tax=Propionibacterium sp. TaxID=1977903 RepID=UPI0039EA65EC